MWRKENPSALLVGMETGALIVENSMEFPQKTKNGTAIIMTQRFHCWEYILGILKHQFKELMHPNVHSSAMYNSQVLETA